jgi:hypothetical protein
MLTITCGLLVFWLSQLQSRIGQQEAICNTLLSKQLHLLFDEDSHVKSSDRHARALDTPTVGSLVEKMADLQLHLLRASCARNERVCVQGPKGDKGQKGDQGPVGEKGSQGFRGNKGQKGEPGNWTSSLAAPTFVVAPAKSFEASVGEKAILKCYADGYPRPQITWSRRTLSLNENAIDAKSNGTLILEGVEIQDFGLYHCTATNSLGSITHSFQVSPTGGAVKVNANAFAGRNISLRCSLCLESGYSFKWHKPRDGLRDRLQIDGCVLTIMNSTVEDSDNYTCVTIKESNGETLQENISLTVFDPTETPSLSTTPHLPGKFYPWPGVAVDESDDAVLKCGLCGFPGVYFTWERIGAKIPVDRILITDCTLVISKATLQDAGNYTCIVRFKSKFSYVLLRETIPLTVKSAARVTSRFADIITVPVGQRFELQCDGAGPPVEVYWTKESARLSHSGTGTLIIDNVTQQDSGLYYCHAVNYLGQDVKEVQLVVTKLEFVDRPPAEITAFPLQSVVINCTARLARGFPFVFTYWAKSPPPLCEGERKLNVLSNGSLVISNIKIQDEGFYECKSSTTDRTITSKVYLNVSTTYEYEWMLTTDYCGGFRQSTYNGSVYYAVSASNVWDRSRYYSCPRGYHWACTEEGRRIFTYSNGWSGNYVYRSQCGWSGYSFRNSERYYFRFRDSSITDALKNAGGYDEIKIEYSSATNYFAGIVCIKN